MTQPQWIEVAYQILPQADNQGFPVDSRAAIALAPGKLPVMVAITLDLEGQGVLDVYHQTKPHGEHCRCWEKTDTQRQVFTIPEEPTPQATLVQMAKMTGAWMDALQKSFYESQSVFALVPPKGGFAA